MAKVLLLPTLATTTTTLLLLLILSPTPTTFADPIPVLDTDGNPLQVNTSYTIGPAANLGSGGITIVSIAPPYPGIFYVGIGLPLSPGLPLKFVPRDPEQEYILESSDLDVVFDDFLNDRTAPWVWKLSPSFIPEDWLVATGRVAGPIGSHWFQIQKAATGNALHHYEIVVCPGVNPATCSNVGVLNGDTRVLGVSINDLEPLVVIFQKVKSSQNIKMVA